MSIQIPLGKRGSLGVAVVDDADYALVSRHTWTLKSGRYVGRTVRKGGRLTTEARQKAQAAQ